MKATVLFIVGLTLTTLLSACGDRDKDSVGTATTTPPQADSFITTVRGVVATAPDETEPADIDNVQATAPDTTEPEDL